MKCLKKLKQAKINFCLPCALYKYRLKKTPQSSIQITLYLRKFYEHSDTLKKFFEEITNIFN